MPDTIILEALVGASGGPFGLLGLVAAVAEDLVHDAGGALDEEGLASDAAQELDEEAEEDLDEEDEEADLDEEDEEDLDEEDPLDADEDDLELDEAELVEVEGPAV